MDKGGNGNLPGDKCASDMDRREYGAELSSMIDRLTLSMKLSEAGSRAEVRRDPALDRARATVPLTVPCDDGGTAPFTPDE